MPRHTHPQRPPQATETGSAKADPRSPFVFDLRELGRRPGNLREYRRVAPAPGDLGRDVIGVPAGSPVELDVRLESVTEGVLVTGHVSAALHGECGRCLEPLDDHVDVDLCELFAYAASVTDETTEQDEVYRVSGELLDVEPVVRDLVVLSLPWTPLCTEDCAGLCPECGARLVDLPADHAHERVDPRWAALAGFAAPQQGGPDDGTG